MLIIRILLISAQLCSRTTTPLKTSPPPKTPTYSNTRSRKDIFSIATPFTLLLIPGTPSTTFSTITSTSTENIGVYLAITVFTHVNIVYKRVAEVVKDIWAIDH